MSKAKIDAMLDNLSELENKKKELEKEIKTIQEELKKDLEKTESKETGKYIVRYTTYTTNRFDSKSFEVSHPKLYKLFLVATTARRFSYSAK